MNALLPPDLFRRLIDIDILLIGDRIIDLPGDERASSTPAPSPLRPCALGGCMALMAAPVAGPHGAGPAQRFRFLMVMAYSYIAVEGLIGAGKTTLAKRLAAEFSARLVLEEFDDNPFLPRFYELRSAMASRWSYRSSRNGTIN